MKKFFLIILFFTFSQFTFSQGVIQKNILYLIPFYTDRIEEVDLSLIENDDQLDSQLPFQLAGFWNGAKIALQEFKNDSIHVNVIVKDVTDNVGKLRNIMEDKDFMATIDLIIGPFYSDMFFVAAGYAKKYEIPIVNPFSSRRDILTDNEFVYKAMPPFSVEPQLFYDIVIADDRDANIILWSDNEQGAIMKEYEEILKQQEITPIKLHFDADISNFVSALKPYRQNIVILSSNSTAKIINNFRTLYVMEDMPDFILLIPEKWISDIYSELEIFNAMDAYYFSNYHVDYQSEKVLYFMSEYVEYYSAPPTLEHFTFQSYDITRYFLQALVHNFDHDKIKIKPLAMDLQFAKTPSGGFENQKKRLLKIENYEVLEITKEK